MGSLQSSGKDANETSNSTEGGGESTGRGSTGALGVPQVLGRELEAKLYFLLVFRVMLSTFLSLDFPNDQEN